MPKRFSEAVESVLSQGTDLEEFGSANWGLRRADALEAISRLRELKVPVLGGDVWEIKDAKPFLTYDSWFYQRQAGEPFESFLEGSIERARRYIQEYGSPKSDQVLFEIIVGQSIEDRPAFGKAAEK